MQMEQVKDEVYVAPKLMNFRILGVSAAPI